MDDDAVLREVRGTGHADQERGAFGGAGTRGFPADHRHLDVPGPWIPRSANPGRPGTWVCEGSVGPVGGIG
jgi:hypothetical protein